MLPRPLSPDEIQQLPWREAIEGTDWSHRRWAAAQRLAERASAFTDTAGEGNELTSAALRVIGGAISVMLHVRAAVPFGPMMVIDGRRSFSIEDVSEPERALLAHLSHLTEDPWLRARFGDLALSCDVPGAARDWRLGQLVVRAYCEYLEQVFLTERAIDGIDECHRGLKLFRAYAKRDEALHARYWSIIQAQIADGLARRVPGLVFPLCDEAMDRHIDIVASLGPQVEAVAQALSQEGQHRESGRYFDYAHRLWRRVGEAAASRRCQTLQGEALVSAATDPAAHGLAASMWLMEGIQILRRAQAPATRIAELKEELARVQRASLNHFTGHRYEVEITKIVDLVDATIVGPTLFEGLLQMTYGLTGWPAVTTLRAEVLKNAREHPLSNMFASQHTNSEGAIIATQPPLDTQEESSVFGAMVSHAKSFDLDFRAKAIVVNAVPRLHTGFQPTLSEIKEIVDASPLSPPDRTETLSRGLHAGIVGDWIAAGVYLIPFSEALVRAHLQRGGAVTRTILEDDTQAEMTLTALLDHPDAVRMFGTNLQFELKVLLTEPLGYNLRNDYCHGLITDQGLETTGVVNLWWTIWRMLLWPWAPGYLAKAKDGDRASTPQSGDETARTASTVSE